MRRLPLLIAAVMVVAVATPASAVPPPGVPAAQTAHLDFSGRGAVATWSTCPGDPDAGDVCTFTFLSASFVKRENRVPVRAASALFEQATLLFGEDFETTLISATFASGPIDLHIDQALSSASFAATVGGQTCVPVGDDILCEDAVVALTGSWTGTGELERVRDNSTPGGSVAGSPFLIVHERRSARAATAVATRDGAPIPGGLVFAEVFDSTRSFILVCRGGPSVDPADCPAP